MVAPAGIHTVRSLPPHRFFQALSPPFRALLDYFSLAPLLSVFRVCPYGLLVGAGLAPPTHRVLATDPHFLAYTEYFQAIRMLIIQLYN